MHHAHFILERLSFCTEPDRFIYLFFTHIMDSLKTYGGSSSEEESDLQDHSGAEFPLNFQPLDSSGNSPISTATTTLSTSFNLQVVAAPAVHIDVRTQQVQVTCQVPIFLEIATQALSQELNF
ncbi:unnamed protein product [Allacma fusca]|uniref:Uncharacterized protein n=1 Tax=Allacma fusca TaxID=39272 RepID=A0A8J2L5V5_9HEXA|nr:unnamed protein product [Allacma fusca]